MSYKFVPYQRVLVRKSVEMPWIATFFSDYVKESDYKYRCVNGEYWEYCIPYDGNEELIGTKKSPD